MTAPVPGPKPAPLPVEQALPELRAALAAGRNATLSAPPGSGKTTRVPLALLKQPWLAGRAILMLEPRRLAARAAARFMAAQIGEAVGETVGYRVRLDTRVSPRTRVEVVTEGILTRRLQQDPALDGVGLVIFDEFHERSLQADLGLALCLDVQRGLRDDLRLLAMSATLDATALETVLGDVASIEAAGRSHPVAVSHLPPAARLPPAQAVVPTVVSGVQGALAQGAGDVLVFLPGVAEIRRAESALAERLAGSGVLVCPLYGDLDSAAQDRAIRPDPDGRRRVVLATAIAETSLTIGGVDGVVDAGLSRVSRFDPDNGLTRLVTERVSRAAAEQRCGRAGRLGPGRCIRLWPEGLVLNPRAQPEILQADLAPLVLELALWGVTEPAELSWIDPPPRPAVAQARELLQRLEALDGYGRITPLGRRMAALPLHPRLAHMLLRAAGEGALVRAADLAALLGERDILPGPGPRPCDLERRLDALEAWRAGRDVGVDARACRRVEQVAGQLRGLVSSGVATGGVPSAGTLVALAYPDRVARAREGPGGAFLLANGRGALLPRQDDLATREWLAVAALDAGEREGRVFLAAALDREELEALFSGRISEHDELLWDPARKAVRARRERRLDALVLERRVLPRPPADEILPALLAGIRREGPDCLPWTPPARALQARVLCLGEWQPEAGWPNLSDAALMADLERWLAPWLDGVADLDGVARLDLAALLRETLDWPQRPRLDALAPERLQVPSGSRHVLRYAPGGPPVLAVRLQEMFGLCDTPRVCEGRVAVVLHLLSPARRPLQITRDLAGFWERTYAEVRKEMKGRYPKHYWPEDPRAAVPTARVRPG